MMELIVYALLAAFIFSRLYNSLGRSTGRSTHINFNKLVDILEKNTVEESNIERYIDNTDENMTAYREILKKDKDFSIDNFIQASSKVFEMIINHFNHGNLTQLKHLVDNDLYNSFAEKITSRGTVDQSTVIVSIVTQKITEIKIVRNVVFISVYFLSEQINFSKNDKGEIIAGDTSTINRIEDVWQFKRNVNISDPTWLLTSIKNDA